MKSNSRSAIAGAVLIAGVSLAAIFAPWITRFSYEDQNIADRLQSPSLVHWLGTDPLGRDLFSRIVYGARMSLEVGVFTALFALLVGGVTGALAGYFGGWLDSLISRVIDLFYIFPSLLLAILVGLLLGRGPFGIILALGLVSWVTQARLVRAQVMQARELPYVEAARALGAGHMTVLFRHILPNLWGPIIVSLCAQIPSYIMAESFLSFLGLGLQPPASSWGTLAAEGFRGMRSYPHLILGPGIVLFVTMLAFNYVGNGLRDWLED